MMRSAIFLFVLSLTCAPLRAEILVAVVGPMSGPYSTLGGLMRAGARQAVADINASGGVNGEPLSLDVLDDACDVTAATAVANQIAGKGARLVIGHLCSATSIAASAVYAQHSIVQISPASSNPKYTDERPGNSIFRIYNRADQQAKIAAAYLARDFADARIAIVHDQTAYGKGLADEVKEYLNNSGIKELFNGAYTAGEKDYTAIVSRLQSEKVDVVYVGGYPNEAGLIMRQMRDRNLGTILVSGDAIVSDEYWAITGEAGDGTKFTFPSDPRRNPEAADVVAEFRASNIEPESYVLYAYAAIQVWAQAANKAGSTDSASVSAALSENGFETVLGRVSFDGKGDVALPGFALYEWKAGEIDYAN